MEKNNNQNFVKPTKKSAGKPAASCNCGHAEQTFAYYSRVLNKPFDSIDELKKAESVYYAELKAKEDKAAQKKADAALVEEAFKSLNNTRKSYKEGLVKLTERYSEDLKKLKENFEADKKDMQDILAQAEEIYKAALKEFADKYPEGYHVTLRDGDFETTISGSHTSDIKPATRLFDLFDLMFNL
jgi:uncharacterized protein YicC (UPF0701 family)